MTWHLLASCRNYDPDLFFPLTEHGPGAAQVRAAKAVCATCPVREECLRHALDQGEEFGVWGGTTPTERRALRRAGRRAHPSQLPVAA